MTNIEPASKIRPLCAMATAYGYDVAAMLEEFRKAKEMVTYFPESRVIHRQLPNQAVDVFYFSYGVMVEWGLAKDDTAGLIQEVAMYDTGSSPHEAEFDESEFEVGQDAKILNDVITLPEDNVLNKLAFSHGLAQSVKLAVFEKLIESRILQSRNVPENLAKEGHIPMSRKQLAKMMGKLIVDRNSINLHTDILDTPEFFWEHSDLEPLYVITAKDLDIAARVNVLNRRLDILKDLYEVLSNELENRHSMNLEWIIVVLIFIEVIVTFAKDIFHVI